VASGGAAACSRSLGSVVQEGEIVFEELEHKKTPEEKKLLVLEVVGAVILCAVLGAAAFWFFDYFGKY
jgi:hypothetical protein